MSDEGNYIMMYTYCSILAMVTILTKMLYLEEKIVLGKEVNMLIIYCSLMYHSKALNYFSSTLYTAL